MSNIYKNIFKRYYHYYLYIILLVMPCSSDNENFIVPKKKRISTSVLKEDIGKSLGNVIKITADHVVVTGQMQQMFIANMSELIEQDQKSFFKKGPVQQLQNYAQALENMDQVLSDCHQKILRAFSRVQESIK